MTAEEVAERLLVSQSKISRLENGRRSISQRDVRDLCGVYEVEDHRIVDSLMQMAKDSRQQGWWHAFGDIPYSVYIGLETDAASLRVYDPQVVPGLLQTRAYAEARDHRRAARGRRRPTSRSASRCGCAARTGISDAGATRCGCGRCWTSRRCAGWSAPGTSCASSWSTSSSMSQLPHVTVQVMPFDMGAHPGLNGQYAILEFPDAADSSVVYIEGVTSDLYLEKANDVQQVQRHVRAPAGPGAERGPVPGAHRRRSPRSTPR